MLIPALIGILILFIVSRAIEKFYKIPVTLSLVFFSAIVGNTVHFDISKVPDETFNNIVTLLIPIILIPDIMAFHFTALKKFWKEIFYLAFVSVALSVAVGAFITPYLLPASGFTAAMMFALFASITPTDAVTVTSVFSKYKMPRKLTVFIEGECLFNDAAAVVLFSFVGLPLISGSSLTLLSVNAKLIEVFSMSIVIGFAIGYAGYVFMKLMDEAMIRFVTMYVVAASSYVVAEHFHFAGLLSMIVSMMVFKYFIDMDLKKIEDRITEDVREKDIQTKAAPFKKIMDKLAITREGFKQNQELSTVVAHFANTFLFVSLALMVDYRKLLFYWKEIFVIFIFSTLIRFGMCYVPIILGKYPMRWGTILSLSGMKGGLSIIMISLIPDSFQYSDAFGAIVQGIVLLSTFTYALGLMWFLSVKRHDLKHDLSVSDKEHKIQYVSDHGVRFPKIAVRSAAIKQQQLILFLQRYLEALRTYPEKRKALRELRSFRESFDAVSKTLTELFGNISATNPTEDILERLNSLINNHHLIILMEKVIYDLASALAKDTGNADLENFHSIVLESIDALMLTVNEAIKDHDEYHTKILMELTSDRSDSLKELRAGYYTLESALTPDEKVHILSITNMCERIFWLLNILSKDIKCYTPTDGTTTQW
ncbi:MAG: cation:proton antiporter [Nitrospirae bacterium]|nr:cation:proton antiporter [Nitrospirota bacterium]